MSAESFAEVWNDLPLEDAKIAELLRINAATGHKRAQIRPRTAGAPAERIYLIGDGNTRQLSPTYE